MLESSLSLITLSGPDREMLIVDIACMIVIAQVYLFLTAELFKQNVCPAVCCRYMFVKTCSCTSSG